MDKKPLSPVNDFVFRKIFGEKVGLLRDFLQAVLDLPAEEYQGLTVVDPNLDREYLDDKLGVLDVKVTTKTGKVLDVEVQVKPQRSIWRRMTFYTAKMVVEQVKSGYQYERINRVISILITDFVLIRENDAYHNRFRLFDARTGAHFPDSIEIDVLEIPKMREADGTQLGNWMRFFGARTEEDFMSAAQTSSAIEEAWGVIKVLSGDERARALAEAREKARMDLDSWLGDARHEGREEGLQEGRQEGLQKGRQEEKLAVARNALGENLSAETVAKLTGLSLEDVKRLADGLRR
ncbi:MAG: Rpn family recombination-promoting nuclease/putative transposase [Desulfovibrio sp.]|jgi:predicted transposase/invertase (TIGR01784 family)|nr:Rpn family recombination-promoting nuclease/putative transposase [Desulfovibrio sp.]